MLKTELPHPKLNFIRSNHRPYYIATGEWTAKSMGFRVPFLLCHALNELGYEAYVIAQKPAPNLRTPLITQDIVKKHKEDKRVTIAVYTEAMWGNTLQADVVVQWMLNRSGRVVDSSLEQNITRFYWDELYANPNMNSKPNILRFPTINEDIFYNDGNKNKRRKGFAYYAHKYLREGNGVIADEIRSNGISLCQDIPRTQEEIADILRSVEALYCYEDSAITVEAALCGCSPILVNTDFMREFECERCLDYIISEDDIDITGNYPFLGTTLKYYDEYTKEALSQYLRDFVDISQNAPVVETMPDKLTEYCRWHDKLFIYGGGLIGALMYNFLVFNGTDVKGFVVSDEHITSADSEYMGLPVIAFSKFKSEYAVNSGLLLGMSGANSRQVIQKLEKTGVNYFREHPMTED